MIRMLIQGFLKPQWNVLVKTTWGVFTDGPKRSLVTFAANGNSEPRLPNCCIAAKVRFVGTWVFANVVDGLKQASSI